MRTKKPRLEFQVHQATWREPEAADEYTLASVHPAVTGVVVASGWSGGKGVAVPAAASADAASAVPTTSSTY